jgi:hypothetical protein
MCIDQQQVDEIFKVEIRNKTSERTQKINTLKDKLINKRLRQYKHVLRMNGDRIPMKV